MKLKLAIKRIERSTPDSITLFFDKIEDIAHYKAGQYLSLSFLIDNEIVSRTYSFNSSPFTDSDVSITARLIPGGRLSSYLVNHVIEGEQVILEGPFGNFVIEPRHENRRHLIMFAAGSGITPIMSMIKSILHKEPSSKISLIYSNRSDERVIFKSELRELQKKFPNALNIFHVITQSEAIPYGLPVFFKGRLSKLIVRKHIKSLVNEGSLPIEFFLCGPYDFMQMIEESITPLNMNAKINKENFYTPLKQQDLAFDYKNLLSREVVVQWRDQDYLVSVSGGQSILSAAFQRNLNLPHSCKEGQCGSCRSILISGEVKLRKNHVLNKEELKRSQILLCQSYPVSDNVIVRPMH